MIVEQHHRSWFDHELRLVLDIIQHFSEDFVCFVEFFCLLSIVRTEFKTRVFCERGGVSTYQSVSYSVLLPEVVLKGSRNAHTHTYMHAHAHTHAHAHAHAHARTHTFFDCLYTCSSSCLSTLLDRLEQLSKTVQPFTVAIPVCVCLCFFYHSNCFTDVF